MNSSVSSSIQVLEDVQPGEGRSPQSRPRWQTFEDILQGLHRSGIYLRADQLATFLIFHGLPVNLAYVPPHLKQKAQRINDHYQGDMAQLEEF